MWYDEAKNDLVEEHPEMSEEELFTEGMQRFRQLPKEERQVRHSYLLQARQNGQNMRIQMYITSKHSEYFRATKRRVCCLVLENSIF